MNCTECNEVIKTCTKDVCPEIFGLLDELNIPQSEQLILLNMVDKQLCCKGFMNILFILSEKYK
jgi:hypothetical protein